MSGEYVEAPSKVPDTVGKFWARVEKRGPDECWPWLGYNSRGYGRMRVVGGDRGMRQPLAHTLSWHLAHKDIVPRGMVLHHTCGTRDCVNPAHLVPMAPGEHSRHHVAPGGRCKRGHDDWHVRGGQRSCRTCDNERRRKGPRQPLLVCKRGHSDWILKSDGHRACRVCVNERQRAWREREKARRSETKRP